MSDVIIVALISAGTAVVSSVLTFITSQRTLKQNQQKAFDEQRKAQDAKLDKLSEDITQTLEEHREEYLQGIKEVRDSITDMKATYQTTVSVVELKIDALEKKQDKHNSIIERTYKLEAEVDSIQDRLNSAGK